MEWGDGKRIGPQTTQGLSGSASTWQAALEKSPDLSEAVSSTVKGEGGEYLLGHTALVFLDLLPCKQHKH